MIKKMILLYHILLRLHRWQFPALSHRKNLWLTEQRRIRRKPAIIAEFQKNGSCRIGKIANFPEMPLTLCVENRIIKLCIVVREEGIREHTGGTAESGGVRQIPDKSEAPSNHGPSA
jgi:hypothetical protein